MSDRLEPADLLGKRVLLFHALQECLEQLLDGIADALSPLEKTIH
jgi:hypothetical protein